MMMTMRELHTVLSYECAVTICSSFSNAAMKECSAYHCSRLVLFLSFFFAIYSKIEMEQGVYLFFLFLGRFLSFFVLLEAFPFFLSHNHDTHGIYMFCVRSLIVYY